MSSPVHDYFISYKHAESAALAASLETALSARQFSVWLDKQQIGPGDSILATIELGLSSSIDAIVVISPNYFSGWAEQERRALFSKMAAGRFRIIPILFGITAAEVASRSPMFADISAIFAPDSSSATAESIAQTLVETTKPEKKEVRLYELFFRCVLQHKGYDPDIALFLGVLDGDLAAVKDAQSRGGNPLITTFEIFKRYWRDSISFGCWEEWRKLVMYLTSTGKADFSFSGKPDGVD